MKGDEMKKPPVDSVGLMMWLVMLITGLIAFVIGCYMLLGRPSPNNIQYVNAPTGPYEQGYMDGLQEGLKNITAKCWYENNKHPDIEHGEFVNYFKVFLKSEERPDGWPIWYPRPMEE